MIPKNLQKELRELAPHIKWKRAMDIFETKHLDRSYKQQLHYTLAEKQVYKLRKTKNPTSFKHPFIIIDDTAVQGTTIAALMSFIKSNGSDVLLSTVDNILTSNSIKQNTNIKSFDINELQIPKRLKAPDRNNKKVTFVPLT